MMLRVFKWILAAWLTTAIAFVVDRLAPSSGEPSAETGSWAALLSTWSAHATLVLSALVAGAAAFGVWRLAARFAPYKLQPAVRTAWFPAVLLGLAVAWPLYAAAFFSTTGEWISTRSFVGELRLGAALLGAAGVAVLGRAAYRVPAEGAPRRAVWWAVTGALILCAAGLKVADAVVLPGLYDVFHLLLHAGFSFATLVVARRLIDLLPLSRLAGRARAGDGPRLGRLALGAAALLILVVPLSPLPWFAIDAETRAEVLESSPAASLIATEVLPPHESRAVMQLLESIGSSGTARSGSAPDVAREGVAVVEDASVLLVIVDALRFDAVPPGRPPGGTRFAAADATPFLDSWLSGTHVFERAYSPGSITHVSMPAIFRSAEVHEGVRAPSLPLGQRARDLGKATFAVVEDYFLDSNKRGVKNLIVGFEEVAAYTEDREDRLVPELKRILTSLGGRPFFGWVHIYCMHEPHFAGRHLTKKDGSRNERYEMALRWFDEEFAAIVEELKVAGYSDSTIVVFTSDHGESLGDYRRRYTWHGRTVFEEEVRVPLALRIPGTEGGAIDDVVGNIDLVPTLFELLGASASAGDRGRSLVPLIAGRDAGVEQTYYFEDTSGKKVGVVHGHHKLIYYKKTGLYLLFDLEADPTEDDNLFGDSAELDNAMLRRLFFKNPALFRRHLADGDVEDLLLERLGEAGPHSDREELAFLLRVATYAEDDDVVDEAERIYEEAEDDELRVLVLRSLSRRAHKVYASTVVRTLRDRAGTRSELELVRLLAGAGLPTFSARFTAKRMRWWGARPDPEPWKDWLELTAGWGNKPVDVLASALETILASRRELGVRDRRLDELLLGNLASVAPPRSEKQREAAAELAREVRSFLDHEHPLVATEAVRALTSLRDGSMVPRFEKGIDDQRLDMRVRCAMIRALGVLGGRESLPALYRAGDDPMLTYTVVAALRSLEDETSLPYLRKLSRRHPNIMVRQNSARLIKRIKAKAKQAE
jgi:hypothetical protein